MSYLSIATVYTPFYNFSALIIYTKDEIDPDGYCSYYLGNLLTKGGIICDADCYHVDENLIDRSLWVDSNVKTYIATPDCYVILVCSPAMKFSLDERNATARIEMVSSCIDGWILRYYMKQNVQKFLPILINDTPTDCIPPILSDQAFYRFPYDRLCEMPGDVSIDEVLNHPDFASLRKLIAMLFTEVQAGNQGELYYSH